MKKPYLILDCNGIAYRAFHSTGGLTDRADGKGPGTIYGFLGTVMSLQGKFDPARFIFCFDKGDSKRMESFPDYKKKRKAQRQKWNDKLKAAHNDMHRQIRLLRKKILKQLGFKNVFAKEGYEADDIIARVCQRIGKHPAIIVSQDSDMYQLITKRINVYNPKTQMLWTKKVFKKEFGIKPKEFIQAKAIAGCGTDEIGGVKGVGEATAIKFIRGELKMGSAKWKLITCADGVQIRCRNVPLVCLPLKGTPEFELKKDKKIKWIPVLDSLGMKSLNKRLRGVK